MQTATSNPTEAELRARSEAALREVLEEERDPRAAAWLEGLLAGDSPRA